MTNRTFIAALVLASLVPVGLAQAGTVIANNNLNLEAADVKPIFTGDMQSKAGVHLTPVDNLAEQENFLAKVVGSDSTKYQNHWTKKSFREGLNPPAVDGTDAEVINFVRQTPGAVGYISGAAPAGVKVVMTY